MIPLASDYLGFSNESGNAYSILIGTALRVITECINAELKSRRVPSIAIRRVLGGQDFMPPLFNLVLPDNNDAIDSKQIIVSRIVEWTRNSTPPVEEFIIQSMRPSLKNPGDLIGNAWSRTTNGESISNGFIRQLNSNGTMDYLSFTQWYAVGDTAAKEVNEWLRSLEDIYGTPCRVSFGVSDGKTYLLSLHSAETSSSIKCQVLADQVRRGLRTRHEALLTLEPKQITSANVSIANLGELRKLACVSPTGHRVASGRVAFSGLAAKHFQGDGSPVILIKENLLPADAGLIGSCDGFMTARGGISSHMIVLSRGIGKATIAGVDGLKIYSDERYADLRGFVIKEGDWVTLIEASGSIYAGRAEATLQVDSPTIEVVKWSIDPDIRVLVNADSVSVAESGFLNTAEGIGLCRSENHITDPSALLAFQRFILGDTTYSKKELLAPVFLQLSHQLINLLRVLAGRPIHYRLLDAPATQFIPPPNSPEMGQLSNLMKVSVDKLSQHLLLIAQSNPTQGNRGCRWGLTSGFYEAQMEMAFSAAMAVAAEGNSVEMTIVVPLVSTLKELQAVRAMFDRLKTNNIADTVSLKFGCMVETPRAALTIINLAPIVDSFSFGTNDLTQAIWSMSRDDASQFVPNYLEMGIVDSDPFAIIDKEGVGEILHKAVSSVKTTRQVVEMVVCGEHASVPRNATFWHECGVSVLSCRPDTIGPVRLALYQAKHYKELPDLQDALSPTPTRVKVGRKTLDDIWRALQLGHVEAAQQVAMAWAECISKELGLEVPSNWKYFKRDIVAIWFGRREFRRFREGWTTVEVLDYAEKLHLLGHIVRYSLFPKTIACHAISDVLPDDKSIPEWEEKIEAISHDIALEVFPQQPITDMCFRAVFSLNRFQIEAGIGQAMNVFEKERGQHAVITAEMQDDGSWHLSNPSTRTDFLTENLQLFLAREGIALRHRLWDMAVALGPDWIAIEGYYSQKNSKVFVCDMDLPLDVAFHITS
jgi:phosphoenolpyruvate synthase/pyruvate phosphate dikinase